MEFFNDIGTDPSRPSLFELVAQEQLRDLLQPALKYVLSVFAQRYPRYLLRIVNRHEEFYALLMFFVEKHYLRTHAASFAENFYGLKRRRRPLYDTPRAKVAVGSTTGEGKLREKDIRRSLFFLVAVPYLRAKSQDYYEAVGGGVDSSLFEDGTDHRSHPRNRENNIHARFQEAYKKAYPWLNVAFETWLMCYNVAYLFDRSAFYRPWLSWIGTDLRRIGPDDMQPIRKVIQNQSPSLPRPKTFLSLLRRLIWRSPRLVLESLKVLLPTAIFFIKFLEWWYSPSSPARTVAATPSGPQIPPPKLLKPHPQGLIVDNTKYGECPLCSGPIANATALPSGYVFCYRCVHQYVEEHERCPVTLMPAAIWQLRKILAVDPPLGLSDLTRPGCFRIECVNKMHFGKQILAQQIPGWSLYYLDYKGLKKIVSSLTAGRNSVEAATLAVGDTPAPGTQALELQDGQTLALLSASGRDEDRGPHFQAHKVAFFFKLERELEKINSFYLQKEAELKLRLETLLSKRMAAASRLPPATGDSTPKDHVEWKAVEEGFRVLERDLAKLQQFVEINAIGFRKILKKWDKRSKSTTKELYLSRQVDVQPVFNRKLIGELADVVAQVLLDLTDLTIGLSNDGSIVNDMMLTHQIALERSLHMGPYRDLETNLQNAVKAGDERAIRELVQESDTLLAQPGSKAHVTRVLWKVIIDAPPSLADLILSCPSVPFDLHFVDDINGRTCLHEAAIAGQDRLVNMCITGGIEVGRADVYGRTPLHYAAMNGYGAVCSRLISTGLEPSSLDLDNYSPLMYAVLRGNIECVAILLNGGRADLGPPTAANDLIPLSLACRVGQVDVVQLLLQHNAKNIPNTNGEFPIHIAAQEGHAEICRILREYEGWDVPDKYNEWTPLFHAARNGHARCVHVLLELGSRAHIADETGRQAVFYSAWYGHPQCVKLLLGAAPGSGGIGYRTNVFSNISSMAEDENLTDADLDAIPSLSLPPPIMPYRVYGHSFIDKTCLIHISIGHSFSRWSRRDSPVHLLPRFMHVSTTQYPHPSPLFKLVMTCRPDIAAAPYSIPIPLRDERDFFTFQTADLGSVYLEFSICPNFGTKTIGRAIALSSMLLSNTNAAFVLPILDHRLHMIGEIRFEARIITPLKGVTLEVGGAIETYWKSLATPFSVSPEKPSSKMAQPFRTLGMTQTSPSNLSISGTGGHTITTSSLVGDYVYLTIQVTRDLHPVVYNKWRLPVPDFDLGVSDVTLAQLQSICSRVGSRVDFSSYKSISASEWQETLSSALIPLRDLMKVLPTSLGMHLDLAFSSCTSRKRNTFAHGHTLGLNDFVDSVLKAVYHGLPFQPHRRIVFGSFNPDVCAALNWKQPNYPVFLASECGVRGACTPNETALGPEDVDDRRLSSISAAVDWAKANNLLGIFLDADLLIKVPSLVQGVKDTGLLLGVYGKHDQCTLLNDPSDGDTTISVDAFIHEGVVTFLDHSSRGI
ncbi:cyclin-dependent protein kinase inhibitor [Fomitiporia mediterranea MF3/22]|uniref:cyclin-dependent protein kinase inhibitor n=1 Tax=Fomitiporia mediterranea (strain MF3/22) TaxID=694068 RepID=UPI000440896E|nr:cyclin-dependent protein kinase inhibitor [Fomitiporia mediterranea MF3/22]EJD01250.1 cyclin-dependent protein kinase inhibitor [Fomitiporia mediterranea MF3/22]